MSGVRFIVDIDPSGASVCGQVAAESTESVAFDGWLELMQTLCRAVSETESLGDEGSEEAPS
ncbi:MAG TPA: hypothetical protein VGF25_14345 [Thermoleophilaceae bacterium]|jgi:hypothetical protein